MEVLNLVTMSSLEVSNLVESNHADVRRSIERLAAKEVIILPPVAEVSNPGFGPKTISVYNLDKRSSIIVVAQLSPEFTARLVDRWQELENIVAAPVKAELPPMTISEKYEQMLAAQRLVQDEQLKVLFPLIWQEVSDGVQNDIVAMFGGQKRIQGTDATPLDIMEIAKREGIVVPANSKSVLGKHVKAQSSVAPVSIERIINGSVRSANAYTNHVEVAGIIKKYLSRLG
jgi:phage regulator Rha-like protein